MIQNNIWGKGAVEIGAQLEGIIANQENQTIIISKKVGDKRIYFSAHLPQIILVYHQDDACNEILIPTKNNTYQQSNTYSLSSKDWINQKGELSINIGDTIVDAKSLNGTDYEKVQQSNAVIIGVGHSLRDYYDLEHNRTLNVHAQEKMKLKELETQYK